MSGRTRWAIALPIVAAFAVSQHVTGQLLPPPPWASPQALGDVAVSFDQKVQLFDNVEPASSVVEELPVAGVNAGLAFDASLNLFVTNTNINAVLPAEPVHKVVTLTAALNEDDEHESAFIGTQANPKSIVFAADGTFYVASPGSPATIRRYSPNKVLSATFPNVPTDSTTCIGIDLDPDQQTLYYVSGGRTIRTATGVNGSSPGFAPLPNTLPNPGTACGLRLLAPQDVRDTGLTTSPSVGGILVADGRNIKRVNSLGLLVGTPFNAGSESDSQKQWVDVALDPNTRDFWGVEAGFSRLAKFRISSPASVLSLTQLESVPHGIAINGELRAAQTIRLVTSTANVATFLQGTPSQHSWKGVLTDSTSSLAIQAVEVRPEQKIDEQPDVNNLCPASLYVDCRLSLFPSAVPKTYSRGRAVFYRETLLKSLPPSAEVTVTAIFPGSDTDSDTLGGLPCTVGGTRETASALLRDPWPHTLFSFDPSFVFYGGDDGITTRTIKFNDSIVVNRGDAVNFMRILSPNLAAGKPYAVAQSGRVLPINVEVRNPLQCAFVDNLEEVLVLSVTDVSQNFPEFKGRIIGDSENIGGILSQNGLSWAKVAGSYRMNLPVDSKYIIDHTYRVCVTAAVGEDDPLNTAATPPVAPEVCRDVLIGKK